MFSKLLLQSATSVLESARAKGFHIVTAESCTGGLIAGCLTEIAGSSDVVECGFVTYSNGAKHSLLGVPKKMIVRHGAVSEQVARAMAQGALNHSQADISISVTGIAGPGGGTSDKPVGLVHMASAQRSGDIIHEVHHFGDIGRSQVRLKTVEAALNLSKRLIT